MTDISALVDIAPHTEAMEHRVTSLLDKMLDEAEAIMEYGTVAQRVQLITKGLPAILRVFSKDENAHLAELRSYFEELNAAEVGSIGR